MPDSVPEFIMAWLHLFALLNQLRSEVDMLLPTYFLDALVQQEDNLSRLINFWLHVLLSNDNYEGDLEDEAMAEAAKVCGILG